MPIASDINPSTILNYSLLQLGAEALFGVNALRDPNQEASIVNSTSVVIRDESDYIDVLRNGNIHSSRFTATDAEYFATHFEVLEHISNTGTGFSGTLFKCVKDDLSRGLVRDQKTISFRSTEFIDDSVRDSQATNDLEIKSTGWAWGQIADMMNWYDSLKDKGLLSSVDQIGVTGYSLGGHLATTFGLILEDRGQANSIKEIYTFNGAGVGETIASNLNSLVNIFNIERQVGGSVGLFTTAIGQQYYNKYKNLFNGNNSITEDQVQTAINSIQITKVINPELGYNLSITERKEIDLLLNAFDRIKIIVHEAARLTTISNEGMVGGDALAQVSTMHIDQTRLDYQLAVLHGAESTKPVSLLDGALNLFNDVRLIKKSNDILDERIFNVYGDTSPSMVSNSQYHYGSDIPLYIEDQPLSRGDVIYEAIKETITNGGVKLLVPDWNKNDFGDTHSLVLLVDSLNVQNLYKQLDPSIKNDTLKTIFNRASNSNVLHSNLLISGASAAGFIAGGLSHSRIAEAIARAGLSFVNVSDQGLAEGDTVEATIDALRNFIFGKDIPNTLTTTMLDPNNPINPLIGGTWAKIDNRQPLDTSIKQLTDSTIYQSLLATTDANGVTTNKVNVIKTADISDITNLARYDFGVFLALATLSPVALKAISGQQSNVAQILSANWLDLYSDWQSGQISEEYLDGRRQMLEDLKVRNDSNFTGSVIAGGYNADYLDVNNQIHFSSYASYASLGLKRVYRFGGDGADQLAGIDYHENYLFGGRNGDYLTAGLGGDNYLEGGNGNDSYYIYIDGKADVIRDYDGSGEVVVLNGDAMTTLTGGNFVNDESNTFVSADGLWIYQTSKVDRAIENTLTITKAGFGLRTIVARIEGWKNGDLGINLVGEKVINWPGVSGAFISGDQNPDKNDVLVGTIYDDLIQGLKGDDILNGAAGNDSLYGDEGNDILHGDAGNDSLHGDEGNDILYGDAGNDTLFDDEGHDQLHGGAGNDVLYDDNGNDILYGDEGDDTLFGIIGNNTLYGGAGNDNLVANVGNTLHGGDGNDRYSIHEGVVVVENGGGIDLVTMSDDVSYVLPDGVEEFQWSNSRSTVSVNAQGNSLNNYIQGTFGDNKLEGYAGDDIIDGGNGGNDIIDGGSGDNSLTSGSGNDTMIADNGKNRINAGNGNNTITVGNGGNRIITYSGYDTVTAGSGHDVISVGKGHALIKAGDGNNQIYGSLLDNEIASIISGTGNDIIKFTAMETGKVWIDAGSGNNQINTGAGDDQIVVGDGDDVVYANDGKNVIRVGSGNNQVYAGADDDDIVSGSGNDVIYISGGANKVVSGAGNDTIYDKTDISVQKSGINTIDSGEGNDTVYLDGGAGSTVNLGSGNNALYGSQGDLDVTAGSGNDDVTIDNGTNIIRVGDGRNRLSLGAGSYTVTAGAGNDSVQLNDANNDLNLGNGNNVVFYKNKNRSLQGTGVNHLVTGNGDDYFDLTGKSSGNEGNNENTIEAGNGQNIVLTGVGNDTITTGIDDDYIDVAAGNNVIDTGAGNNTIKATDGNNNVISGSGNDDISVGKGTNVVNAGDGNNTIKATDGNNNVISGSGNDDISVGKGTNVVNAGDGNNIVIASGIDTVTTGVGADYIDSAFANHFVDGNDQVTSGAGNDTIYVGAGNDMIKSGDGDDLIWDGSGDDIIEGGKGNDIIGQTTNFADSSLGNDTYRFSRGDGQDTIYETPYGSLSMTDKIEFIDIASSDVKVSASGNDLLIKVKNSSDSILCVNYLANFSGAVIESIQFSDGVTWSVSDVTTHLEAEEEINGDEFDNWLYGSDKNANTINGYGGNDNIYGKRNTDTLNGGSGNDYLDGNQGADLLTGGTGDDYYKVDNIDDVVIEHLNEGNDTVQSSIDYVLSENIENLELASFSSAIKAIGNSLDNSIVGNTENNILQGGKGNDILDGGWAGSDTYIFDLGDGVDTIIDYDTATNLDVIQINTASTNATLKQTGQNLIISYSATDSITVVNYFGDAASKVEQIKFSDNVVWAAVDVQNIINPPHINHAPTVDTGIANQTIEQDQAFSFVIPANAFKDIDVGDVLSYSITKADGSALPSWLSFNVATRTLSGTPNAGDVGNLMFTVKATDTVGANVTAQFGLTVAAGTTFFTATDRNDRLFGTTGDDTLDGLAGDDDISGLTGNDTIFGGAGEDTLLGHEGNDTIRGGTHNDRLLGHDGDDKMYGEDGDDSLYGSTGSDALYGGSGNDIVSAVQQGEYIFANSNETNTLYGEEGNDTLYGSGGADYFDGGDGDDSIVGEFGDDIINGSVGNDMIYGGYGNDMLTGGSGNDTFVFDSEIQYVTVVQPGKTEMVAFHNIDTINDFTVGEDLISLNNGVFTSLGEGELAASQFKSGAGLTSGEDEDDFIIYDQTTGDLYYDADGSGEQASVLFAHLVPGLDLNNTHFNVFNAPFTPGYTLDEFIMGGAGDDVLDSGDGHDQIYGEAGNDTLLGGNGNDTLDGGEGHDTLNGQADDDWIYGAAGDDMIMGGDGFDILIGDDGDDILNGGNDDDYFEGGSGADQLNGDIGDDSIYGGYGNDQLTGGDGVDRFIFNTALEYVDSSSVSVNDVDTITDFTMGVDFILFTDDIFTSLKDSELAASQFKAGAGLTSGEDQDDFIIYDQTTGDLYYDADGSGTQASVLFAHLTPNLSLDHTSFNVYLGAGA